MLDLTPMNRHYEIRLLDGSTLNLKRPTQAMYETLIALRDMRDRENSELRLLTAFSDLFARILNRNEEGRSFTKEELREEYDFQVVSYVIQDYFSYWQKEVDEEVNFPQGQQAMEP